MSYPVYMVYAGDTLPIFFDSFDGGTGASITMSGLAVTDIEIYKDGSTTQRASDAGYTLLDTDGIDFDGITGIHGFSINTGDNTDAGFYAVGSWYHVVVSAITIDAQTVSFVAAAFRIMAAEAVAGVPVVDVSHISGDATAADNCEADYDGTGYAGGTIVKKADATKILGTTLTETSSGYLAAGLKKLLDVATPILAIDAAGLDVLVDRILTRAFGSVTYTGTTRCVLTALQTLRNKFTAAAGAGGYVVKKEDDSTTSWDATLTIDGDGNITAMDPDS